MISRLSWDSASDIESDESVEVINKDLLIATLTADVPFVVEMVGKSDVANAVALNSAVFNLTRIIGVIKAYTTRVGAGPFPTELDDETGRHLSRVGQEFGAVTGRPRRCGWFDAVVVRYSARINGLDAVALTKLDVLDGLPEVLICTGYRTSIGTITEFPADLRALAGADAVYERMPGWTSPTKGATRFEDLPGEAQRYVRKLEELTGVACAIISTGSDRRETIVKSGSLVESWLEGVPG